MCRHTKQVKIFSDFTISLSPHSGLVGYDVVETGVQVATVRGRLLPRSPEYSLPEVETKSSTYCVIITYYSAQRHIVGGIKLLTVSFGSLSEILICRVFLEDGLLEALSNKQLRLIQKSCKIKICHSIR